MEIAEKITEGHYHCLEMGRAGRKGGVSGGGLREGGYKPTLVDRCKTENQKQVLEKLQELSNSEGVYVSKEALRESLADISPDDFQQAIDELEGTGHKAPPVPLVDIIRNSQTGVVSNIKPLSDKEYDQSKFAQSSTPLGYGHALRELETRNEAALAAVRTPEERRIVEEMVARTRMNAGDPENFWTRPELLEESPRLKQEMYQALDDLTERGVLQESSTPEGSYFSLAPYSDSRYPGSELGKHEAYREQFGEEKYKERMKHVSAKMDLAYQMAENEKEQALLFYIQRDNPYLNDDSNFIPYGRITRAMRPLMSAEEAGDLLQSMTARGVFSVRSKEGGGAEYCVADDPAILKKVFSEQRSA